MVAVGQKHGKTLIALGLDHIHRNASHCRNTLDGDAAVVGRENDHIVPAPGAAPATGCIAESEDGSAGGCDFLQLAIREKRNVMAVGRPEREKTVFRRGDRLRVRCIYSLQPELLFPAGRRGHDYVAAIRRNCKSRPGVSWWGEGVAPGLRRGWSGFAEVNIQGCGQRQKEDECRQRPGPASCFLCRGGWRIQTFLDQPGSIADITEAFLRVFFEAAK